MRARVIKDQNSGQKGSCFTFYLKRELDRKIDAVATSRTARRAPPMVPPRTGWVFAWNKQNMDSASFQHWQWLFPAAITVHNLEEAIWLPAWSRTAGRWHVRG